MTTTQAIKDAMDRNIKVLERSPGTGLGTAVTKARLLDGLRCEVEEGPWKLHLDLDKSIGGDDTGPSPGVLGRGALGACLAMGYVLWAAKLGVPVTGIEVTVEADYDWGGCLGVGNGPPGYTQIRLDVTCESPAPEADLRRVVEQAEAYSSYLDVFSRAQTVERKLRIAAPASV